MVLVKVRISFLLCVVSFPLFSLCPPLSLVSFLAFIFYYFSFFHFFSKPFHFCSLISPSLSLSLSLSLSVCVYICVCSLGSGPDAAHGGGEAAMIRRRKEKRKKRSSGGMKIYVDPNLGPYVKDLTEERVSSEEELMAFIKKGDAHRSVSMTKMNRQSSRSHAIFKVKVGPGSR